jgi:sodium-dependent dicarboxylate transporter 2/3/5
MVTFYIPLKGLGYAGHAALGILAFAIIIWSWEALPLAVSSIIVILLQPAVGVVSFEDAIRGFANPIIFLLLGGFMIAEGVTSSGLVDRVAYATLSKLENPKFVILAAILVTGILSAWVDNLVAFAIALPVFRRIISLTYHDPSGDGNFAKSLLLGGSYGSLAGGLATVIGTGPNLIAAAYIKIPFETWSFFGAPLAILLMLAIWKSLITVFPLNSSKGLCDKTLMRSKLVDLGPMRKTEKIALIILAIIVVLLVTAPITKVDSYAVTLFGAVLFFLTGTLTWRHAERNVGWGTIVFFASALSVGNALIATGTANWLIGQMTGELGAAVSTLTITFILMIVGASLTQVVSNVGLAAVLIPIATTLSLDMNLPPGTYAIPAAVACSLSFMFPMSDPTIAMAHGTGYVTSRDIFKAGLPITIICAAISIPLIIALQFLI